MARRIYFLFEPSWRYSVGVVLIVIGHVPLSVNGSCAPDGRLCHKLPFC